MKNYKICFIMCFILFSIPLYAQEEDNNIQKIKEELQTQVEETKKAYEARIEELEARLAQLQSSIRLAADAQEGAAVGCPQSWRRDRSCGGQEGTDIDTQTTDHLADDSAPNPIMLCPSRGRVMRRRSIPRPQDRCPP